MEKGRIGERYILGGENVTFRQMFETLCDLTGLAAPGRDVGRGMAMLAGRFLELRARWLGGAPTLTMRLARDYACAYAWVDSAKAEQELGYQHRPARQALARSVRWFLEHGYVSEPAARRVRLEFRPT
jgi:dihydroflavonol-4-reductase